MLTLGITGGVGAGKSTVLNYMQEHFHAYILEADKAAHVLMRKGQDCFNEIVAVFGEEILGEDGEIDRVKFGAIVFADNEKLQTLNGIVHPAVKKYILDTIDIEEERGEHPVMAVEAALLIEEGYKELLDELWYIYASEDIRRERLITTRGYSDERIDGIFKSQLPDAVFRENCTAVIDTGICVEYTMEQVKKELLNRGLKEY